MPHIMTRQRTRIAGLLLILTAFFPACSEDSQPAPDSGQVSAPPSLSENAPAAETVITLTPAQVQELNIQTIIASRDNFAYPVVVPGIVVPAPDHISLVSAPINGLIVAIHAHEGEKVRKGAVLLEIESLEFANLVAEYLQAEAEAKYQNSRLDRLRLLGEKKSRPSGRSNGRNPIMPGPTPWCRAPTPGCWRWGSANSRSNAGNPGRNAIPT